MSEQTNNRSRATAIAGEIVGEIFQQKAKVATRSEDERKATGAIQDVIFIISMLSCLVLTGLNVTGKMPFRTVVEEATGVELQTMAYRNLNFAVREIEAYRRDTGHLPESLSDVGAPADPRWEYAILEANRYLVRYDLPGSLLEYDSNRNADEFFASVRRQP